MALPPSKAHHPALGLLIIALALVVAGCGGDDGEATTGAPGGPAPAAEEPAAEALLGSGDRVLLIGDSLATVSPPTYADLLPRAARKHGARGVSTGNLAEPGTATADWLPGTPLFEERLRPALADADLVLVTVGGNDLQEALGGLDGLEAGAGALEAADAAFEAIGRSGKNLRRIFKAIRRANPDVRIAYVAYPAYSESTAWRLALGSTGTFALRTALSSLQDAAEDAGADAVVDMTTATADRGGGVDPLLTDVEYLSPAGHRFYAERVAAALSEPPSP